MLTYSIIGGGHAGCGKDVPKPGQPVWITPGGITASQGAACMNSARIATVIRSLRRRPVSRRAAEMAIALIEELTRGRSASQVAIRRQVPREDSDSGDDQVAEDEDIVVNADRLADPSKQR